METKFNFKSAICTSREQSERLLALGLKKETADMHHSYYTRASFDGSKSHFWKEETGYSEKAIPAWSLDRLMELVPHRYEEYCDYANNYMYYYNIPLDVVKQFVAETKYEYLIDCIEWLIKEGCFPKEYLV